MITKDFKTPTGKECALCECQMLVSPLTFPIELACSCRLCFKCAVKLLPQNQQQIDCPTCNEPQKLKNECYLDLINDFKKEELGD